MYRVKKVNGWNKYIVQERVWLIWFNVDDVVYDSKAKAIIAWLLLLD
jgi:hypothetical protein